MLWKWREELPPPLHRSLAPRRRWQAPLAHPPVCRPRGLGGPPGQSFRSPPHQPYSAHASLQHSRLLCRIHGRCSRGRVRRSGGGDSLDSALYDPDVPLKRLQQMLEQAVDDEEYEAAAQLRDVIQ